MIRRSKKLFVTALAVLFAVGCGEDIQDQPVQGVIDGESWEYSAGSAVETGFDDGEFRIGLYSGTSDGCDGGFGSPTPEGASDRYVWAFAPPEPGEYDLGLSADDMTIVFESDEASSYNATDGEFIIDEITDETITGSLYANYDSDYEVNGHFELDRCD